MCSAQCGRSHLITECIKANRLFFFLKKDDCSHLALALCKRAVSVMAHNCGVYINQVELQDGGGTVCLWLCNAGAVRLMSWAATSCTLTLAGVIEKQKHHRVCRKDGVIILSAHSQPSCSSCVLCCSHTVSLLKQLTCTTFKCNWFIPL